MNPMNPMNPIDPDEPTPEDIVHSKVRFEFLENKWNDTNPDERIRLGNRVINVCKKALNGIPSNIFSKLNDKQKPSVRIYILGTEDMRGLDAGIKFKQSYSVPAGCADADNRNIGIHCHLLYAPNEVIRGVFLHELAHIAIFENPLLFQIACNNDYQAGSYTAEFQEEEELVHSVLKSWGVEESFLEIWESTVELWGADWNKHYEETKRRVKAGRHSHPTSS